MAPEGEDLVELLVRFGRALRKSGVQASVAQLELLLEAVAVFDPCSLRDLYLSGRAAFCASKEDTAKYERCFKEFFLHVSEPDPEPANPAAVVYKKMGFHGWDDSALADSEERQVSSSTSDEEVLRHRDFAEMGEHEREQVFDLIKVMRPLVPMRRSARLRPSRRGPIDIGRTIRAAVCYGGDPDRLYRHRQRQRARQCVLLLDVSGSMRSYADPLLLFCYAALRAAPTSTEVLTIGTRLTRLTPALRAASADAAIQSASTAIPDWSGGTRLGEQFKAFLDRWGQRGMARGAVVVILSDGWELGDCALLKTQMQRLQRHSHRIIWCNPNKSGAGYQPIARGMRAVMPYIDDFVEGRTLAELRSLAVTIGNDGSSSRHALLDRRGA